MKIRAFFTAVIVLFASVVSAQTFTRSFATVAEMVAANPNSVSTNAYVMGRSTVADGGEGPFYYSKSSTAATNLGTCFKPVNYNGRWIRVYPFSTLNPLWFGAKGDGVSSDTTAIQDALDTAGAFRGTVQFPAGTFRHSGLNIPQWVRIRGISAQGQKNIGEGATVLKLLDGLNNVHSVTATRECSIENLQIDGNGANVTGDSRGIFFNRPGFFAESDVVNVSVVNHRTWGGYIDAHEVSLRYCSFIENGVGGVVGSGGGLFLGAVYDTQIDHVLCGWNGGDGFKSSANGATTRIIQMDTYYNRGRGTYFVSPYLVKITRLQSDYNFMSGLEIDSSSTIASIDIDYLKVYGSNAPDDGRGRTNPAVSGTYSDVVISGTQYPANVRIAGGEIGLNSGMTSKPEYLLKWANSQSAVGYNVVIQDVKVDTSSGVSTTTGASTQDSWLTGYWTGRMMNHRSTAGNVRNITKTHAITHVWDGVTTAIVDIQAGRNVQINSNLWVSGYMTANGAVYSGRDVTTTKTGLQVKGDTGSAFGLSSSGNFTVFGNDANSNPAFVFNTVQGDSYFQATNSAASGTGKPFSLKTYLNQTGTAGSTSFEVNVTELAKGSGTHNLVSLAVGGTSKFRVQNDGRIVSVSSDGIAPHTFRGTTDTYSRVIINAAQNLDRSITISGNSIDVKDAAGSVVHPLSLNPSGGNIVSVGKFLLGSSSGPSVTQGTGAPSASEPNGSVYHRTDGTGPNVYVRENSTWAISVTSFTGSATWDIPNLASLANSSTTVAVTGAVVGDMVVVSPAMPSAGVVVAGDVTSADTVTIRGHNASGGAVDPPSTTYRVKVIRQ